MFETSVSCWMLGLLELFALVSFQVKKRNSEESSTQWTTGIAEVQLPIECVLFFILLSCLVFSLLSDTWQLFAVPICFMQQSIASFMSGFKSYDPMDIYSLE